jgi:uncharacterized repeat protein (TIGR01451 family)
VKLRPLHRLAALTAVVVAVATGTPAHAATVPNGPAASADAYGLLVDVGLLPTHTPVKLGPYAHAAQEYPVGAATPSQASQLSAGPLPADSSVLDHVGVLESTASAVAAPSAYASAEVADVSLLGAGENAKITADVVHAVANTDCTNAPNAAGTEFVNLVVNGIAVGNTPAPNTVIPVPAVNPVAIVIINEQHPAFDGRGIVVNGIHVISTTTGDPLFRGDVIVSHAMSTVNCTNGAGTTGGSNVIKMTKDATPTVATAGTEVTYTAHVTNNSTSPCLVTQFIEHLASLFDFVSTVGDFGNALDATNQRPGGGTDLVLGNGKTLAVGDTFDQVFTVKVKDGVTPGVYFNNLEILCANLGDFVKGLDAPVRIVDDLGNQPPATGPKPQCSDGKDNDGDGQIDFGKDVGCASPQDDDERNDTQGMPRTGTNSGPLALAGLVLVAAAFTSRRLRPTA